MFLWLIKHLTDDECKEFITQKKIRNSIINKGKKVSKEQAKICLQISAN